MSTFVRHTPETAPQGAAAVVAKVKERYGFIPNLAAYVAESPGALGAILALTEAFDRCSLTPREQQVVLLTVASINECSYCTTVHTGLGRRAGLDGAAVKCVAAQEPLADPRLEALRVFSQSLVEERGWLAVEQVAAFLGAGFTRAQVFDVVMGVALKTFTNYCNHLAGAEPNPEFVAMATAA